MKTLKALFLGILMLGVVLPCYGGEFIVFGPKTYYRETGKPINQTDTFISAVTGSNFTLRLQNGDGLGNSVVTSAIVTLNNVQIVVPSDYQKSSGLIERQVSLNLNSTLSVTINGKPGSNLTITIVGQGTTVPNIVGMTQTDAQSVILAANLVIGNVSWVYNNTVPNGSVSSQNPAAGTSVMPASAVALTISEGPPPVSVPNVVGMTQANAQTAITASMLVIGNITTANSSTVPTGSIISQNPEAGAMVSQGTAVALVISSGPATVTVPNVIGMTQANAQSVITAAMLLVGNITTASSSTVPTGNIISQNPAANVLVAQGATIALVISNGPAPIPDPASVAPPVNGTVVTTVVESTAFLYTGSNPIQTGVAPGTIQVKRAAVLRGQVNGQDGNPLAGVVVNILNHPEFGQTLTRTDGMFDMAVNGGGLLTVNYFKVGYMAVQRQVNAAWNGYAWLPDVVMLPFDTLVSTINLSSSAPIQVARGSVATDADGTRQATLFFSQGTNAQMILPDGTTQTLTSLHVRATEYTVGPNGPKAMPGNLPPTSAYTYAVELNSDEAVAAGATTVKFSQPVNFYVENFLNFPVGGIVPVGYYDSNKATWIPSDNGRVIKILNITGGLADLDIDGSGLNSDATKLAALGITDAERQQLASLYAPGQSLWRAPVTHFTPWDCNWPNAPPHDAVAPDQPLPEMDTPLEDPCTKSGSIIECQNQTLGERIAIAGTPFSLNYRSNRVAGNKAGQTLRIPLTGASVPVSLRSVRLELTVAGTRLEQKFTPAPNLKYDFHWNGIDAYGRNIQGVNNILVRIVYVYKAINYDSPSIVEKAFAKVPTGTLIIGNTRSECFYEVNQEYITTVNYWDERQQGLGAWTLDVHHAYDPFGISLHLGNGTSRNVEPKSASGIISTVTMANWTRGVAIGPDESLYFSDDNSIKKVSTDGLVTTVAGCPYDDSDNCPLLSAEDGVPAISSYAGGAPLTAGPDGSIYFGYGYKVRKITPDGIVNTVAGADCQWYESPSGDGGLATKACLAGTRVTIGPDGSIYIVNSTDNLNYYSSGRVRRVGLDGIITTVAGGGTQSGDGVLATVAEIHPLKIAFTKDGSYLIAEGDRLRKVGPDGIITTVAGGNGLASWPLYGDYGPATAASIGPADVDLSPDGSIIVADYYDKCKVRRVSLKGIITTVAGNGLCSWSYNNPNNYPLGDGGPATSASLSGPSGVHGVAVGPDGSIYIADYGNGRVRRVMFSPTSLVDEFFIASEDGKEAYIFNGYGKHIRTVNSLTNVTLYQFGYDTNGRLATITDGDGNITTIERDSSGNPVAIVAPFGQRSQLTLDANGYINSITNPAGEITRMTYASDGLLTSFVDPKGNASQFSYDEKGFLTRDEDAVGGFSALSSTRSSDSSLVTLTTALNRSTTYLTENLYNGDQRRTITLPSGAQAIQFKRTKGVDQDTAPDATFTTTTNAPDPRFGMQAPLASTTIKTPSGLTATVTNSRVVSLADPGNPLSLVNETDIISFNGRVYTTLFDATLKQSTTTSPAGRKAVALTDSQGRPFSLAFDQTITPVTFSYDTRGRLVQAAQGSQQTSYGYDLLGRVASRSDALGNTSRYGYDNADRLALLTLPSGRAYGFTYDANGNRTKITMPSGAVHTLGYTIINLDSDYTPPGNMPYSWQYSLDKEWIRTVLPSGRSIDAAYDTGGRSLGIVYPEASVSLNYGDQTDRVSRVIRTPATIGTSQQIAFTYDGGLTTGRSFSGVANGQFAYTYDNNFFQNKIILTSGTNTITTVLTRDGDGLVTGYGPFTFTRGGPAGALSNISDTALNMAVTYDTHGRVATRSHTVNGQIIYSIQFTYDSRGNISRKIEAVSGETNAWDYTYDTDGQLTAAKENGVDFELFSYDVNGNRTSYERPGEWSILADYDVQDRLALLGGTAYQFNADGQLTQRGTDTFQYSAQGELLQTTVEGQLITYTYDGTGRRVARTDSAGTMQYLYGNQSNLFQLTAMRDSAGVLSTFYYDNAGLLFALDKGGVRYYIAVDQVGTPKVMSDTTGAVVKFLGFDSFGMPTFDSNPGLKLPVGFAGGLSDEKTGLVRFGYRDYEPGTGRWVAKDPIFFAGGQGNLHVYVQNNPVNYTDPTGLAWFRESDHEYKAGRRGTMVPEGPYGRGRYVDDYVPAGHTFASLHDSFVGMATSTGFPDWFVNVPSMLPLYIGAVGKESLNSVFELFSIDYFKHMKEHDCP